MKSLHRGRRLFLSLLILIPFILAGCATHMPASERLVFHQSQAAATDDSFRQNLTVGASAGLSYIIPFEGLKQAFNDEYGGNSETTIDDNYLLTIPSPGFSAAWRNRLAVGSTAPVPGIWQMDATARISGPYFLTFNKKILFRNTEVILQRRMYYRDGGGVSLGAFYRYDPFELEQEDGSSSSDRFYISWFGVRTVLQTASQPSRYRINLRGVINAGYVPEFETPLISIGMSLGFSNRSARQRKPIPPFDQ